MYHADATRREAHDVMVERDSYRQRVGELERELAAAKERERAAMLVIRELLESAYPHPKEHPTMFAAWTKARAVFPEVKP